MSAESHEAPGPLWLKAPDWQAARFTAMAKAGLPPFKSLSEQARDRALGAVESANAEWLAKGLSLLGKMRQTHAQATGEQVREWLEAQGLEQPTSANAWGSLINAAVRRGALVDSGKVAKMTKPGSHARRTPVWLVA